MDYFNPFFTIFQLLAALNFAQVSKGFREEFAKLIKSWGGEVKKAKEMISEATALSQNISSLKKKFEDFFNDKTQDIEFHRLKQTFDNQTAGIDSLLTPLRSKITDEHLWGSIINTPDCFKPLFMITGFCTTLSMIFIAIAECHTCTSIIAYCYAVLAFILILLGGIDACFNFKKPCLQRAFGLQNIAKRVIVISLIFGLTYFAMFNTAIARFIPSCNIRVYNGLNAGCCFLVLITALLSYVLSAVKAWSETRKRHDEINSELTQFRKSLDDIKENFKDYEAYVEKKIELNTD